MARIRGYMAASLDGYIATADGGVDWLAPFQSYDYGYDRFIEGIGVVVLGRATYDQSVALGWPWGWPGNAGIIVTSRPPRSLPAGVTAWTRGIDALVAHLRALPGKDVWIVGGARLQAAFIERRAIDLLEVFVVPLLLGDGVAMFPKSRKTHEMELVETNALPGGMVRLAYRFG